MRQENGSLESSPKIKTAIDDLLQFLEQKKGATLKEICEKIGWEPELAKEILEMLEGAGLVKKEVSGFGKEKFFVA